MPQLDQLSARLDRLAAYEPGPFPVVSLYLDARPDDRGRDHYDAFVRKELAGRIDTYPGMGPERASLERDAEKIRAYVATIDPAVNGVAVFACSGNDLFETMELAAPVGEHRLHVSDVPHLYPLARIIDEYPRYAVVLADTSGARIFVFAGNALEQKRQVDGAKTRRHKMGGWAQARYQRHVDHLQAQNVKEIVEVLDRIVRDEQIASIVLAGDEVVLPLLREQLSKPLVEKVIDAMKLDIRTPEREVLEQTLSVVRGVDEQTDRQRVDELVGAYRANGLGVVGIERTRRALELGQVDELVIAATPSAIAPDTARAAGDDRSAAERAANELVATARRTGATVRFVEDPALLQPLGGVGAFLRFKR